MISKHNENLPVSERFELCKHLQWEGSGFLIRWTGCQIWLLPKSLFPHLQSGIDRVYPAVNLSQPSVASSPLSTTHTHKVSTS